MKKRVIVVLTVVVVIFIGVLLIKFFSHNSEESAGNHQGSITENGDIESMLSANRELLLKYTDTPSNFAITLLGLDGLVSNIREAAEIGLELTDKCAEFIGSLEDAEINQDLLDFNNRFLDCNTNTLKVKENRDIDSFETALNNTFITIQEYNEFLKKIHEDAGG